MSETGNIMDFGELADDGLDISAIFGGSDGDASEIPLAEPQNAPAKSEAQAGLPSDNTEPPTKDEGDQDLFAVFAQKDEASVAAKQAEPPQQTSISLFDKAPIFCYGGAKEAIEDTSMTFEELRIDKSEDFPELAEGKKVSWTVEYGKTSKYVTDPKGTTIAKIKEEIEKSKAFLDNLKKAKDKEKNPDCLVKPKVTAQSKGIAAYKGVFPSVENARASDKAICLIPAQDGRFYELRKTEMGDFVAPKSNIVEFSTVRAGFTPALPLIPKTLMEQIISFFRCFMNESGEFEAMAHIYWDRENEEFIAHVPKQQVSKTRIDADLSDNILPEERYLLYADIHSHNSMKAKFSATDDSDELATRLYIVVGCLDRYYPSIAVRTSCGGAYQELDPAVVIESVGEVFPHEWLGKVEKREVSMARRSKSILHKFDELLDGLPEVLLA